MSKEVIGLLGLVLAAVITGSFAMWTQRGGASARRATVAIEERRQGLEEFTALRNAAMQDLTTMRAEMGSLREEMATARETLHVASDHIKELRPLVPDPPGPPELPQELRNQRIGL